MSTFSTYFKLGLQHITDLNGFDHMLFIVALCAIYQLKEIKKILILVTAFTVGHSVTLALSVLEILTFPQETIEFLIPVTIFLTSIFNMFSKNDSKKMLWNYCLAAFFGLIHGMGFSNYLKAILLGESLFQPLLAFNIGLEVGQLFIVLAIMALSFLVLNIFKVKQRTWNLVVSGATAGISLLLIFQNKIW